MASKQKRPTTKKHKVLVAEKKSNTKVVDRLTYAAAIIEPIITLPQAIQIFSNRNAQGVSITAWLGYELLQMIWLWYGIAHKDRIIILYSLLYAVIQMIVIVGAILYGGKWI